MVGPRLGVACGVLGDLPLPFRDPALIIGLGPRPRVETRRLRREDAGVEIGDGARLRIGFGRLGRRSRGGCSGRLARRAADIDAATSPRSIAPVPTKRTRENMNVPLR